MQRFISLFLKFIYLFMSCIVMSPLSFLILVICVLFLSLPNFFERNLLILSLFRGWIFCFIDFFFPTISLFLLDLGLFWSSFSNSWCGTFNYCFKALFLFSIMNIHYYKYPSKPCLESQMLIYVIFILIQFKIVSDFSSDWFFDPGII